MTKQAKMLRLYNFAEEIGDRALADAAFFSLNAFVEAKDMRSRGDCGHWREYKRACTLFDAANTLFDAIHANAVRGTK